MSKFVALFDKKEDGKPASRELMLAHIEHLRNLRKQGKLFLCGPFKDSDKVMQILLADDYEEAREYVLMDPFTSAGFFANYVLYELIEANEENNYLLKD